MKESRISQKLHPNHTHITFINFNHRSYTLVIKSPLSLKIFSTGISVGHVNVMSPCNLVPHSLCSCSCSTGIQTWQNLSQFCSAQETSIQEKKLKLVQESMSDTAVSRIRRLVQVSCTCVGV